MSQANQILERIAQIQLLVEAVGAPRPNVLQADAYMPNTVVSAACPFWVNMSDGSGGSSNLPINDGQQRIDNKYIMTLCLLRAESAVTKLGLKVALMWRDAVYYRFAKHVKLSNPATGEGDLNEFILDSWISRWKVDGGYELGDSIFVALQFELTVREFYVQTVHI